MKTGAIKVCQETRCFKVAFSYFCLTLNYKHEAIKKCKAGKVAVKYFESDFVEK